MYSSFAGYHPIVNFLYFTVVIVFSVVFIHPLCLGISLICGFCYSAVLRGSKVVKFNLLYLLPMMIIAAFINPAFNHEGATILTYLNNGNPLTLESIVYGVGASIMIASVVSWFSCYNEIMTSDKFIYLFGRVIPSLSLILSMALRFVPKFKAQIKVISNAQKCVGRDVSNGSVLKRAKNGIRILSIMVTWVLENAIETADSMKVRGYGLKGRTAFSIYSFDKRDKKALLFICCVGTYIIFGAIIGEMYFRYFPSIKSVQATPLSISVFSAYIIFNIFPLIIEGWEDRKWKQLQSKI